jgi:hypothetical protein
MPCCNLCGKAYKNEDGKINKAELHELLNPPPPRKRKRKKNTKAI